MLVASWDDPSGLGGLTTQAESLGELEANLREAVEVHFEPQDHNNGFSKSNPNSFGFSPITAAEKI
jgi:predicted RNase H-like HicB family nuclease